MINKDLSYIYIFQVEILFLPFFNCTQKLISEYCKNNPPQKPKFAAKIFKIKFINNKLLNKS